MTDNDSFKITIKVGDLDPFKINIKRNSEEFYRIATTKINDMWRKFKLQGNTSDAQIFAGIALRFAAQLYSTLDKIRQAEENVKLDEAKVQDLLTEFEKKLDGILIDM